MFAIPFKFAQLEMASDPLIITAALFVESDHRGSNSSHRERGGWGVRGESVKENSKQSPNCNKIQKVQMFLQ